MSSRAWERYSSRPLLWRSVVLVAAALVMYLAARASLTFSEMGERTTPLWIANAFGLTFCLKSAPRRWPGLLLACLVGNLCADLMSGDSLAVSLCLSASNAVEIALCAFAMRRLAGANVDLTSPRQLTLFLAVGGVIAPLTSATLATLMLGLMRGQGALLNLTVWALADGVGLVMVTPVLLTIANIRKHLEARPITPRRLAPLFLLAAVTAAVFSQNTYPAIFVIMPVWALAASEQGMMGMAAGAVIVGVISMTLTALGHGPVMLTPQDQTHRMLLLQAFIAFSNVAMLRFTAGVIQRRRQTHALEELAREAETARAEAVEHARRSQMAEEVAGLGYWRLDARTGVVEWSPQIYAIFGIDRSLAPTKGVLNDYIHPDDLAGAQASFQYCFTTGEPQQYEGRVLHGDGGTRILRSWSKAERGPDGQVAAVLYVMMDVTEQRRAEAELRQARDQAEQAAVVKAEFLANMSHELRTPLTAILGFTGLAEAQTDLPPTARHYVERIGAGSKALLTLVNDVLDFSKLEAGEIRVVPRPSDIVAVAQEVLDLFAEQARAKGLDLVLDQADGVPGTLSLDADRLRQILINLVGNAVKFTDEGVVALQVGYDAEAERLALAVLDTGPGIDPDRQRLLFQRFSQIDGSATRSFGGTGLGLAICKGLVEAMDGEIGVDTDPGRGSRFWFELPAVVVDSVEAAVAGESLTKLSLGDRFLVVDDNRANRDLVRAVLTSLGADVVEAEDGIAGVQAAQELPFDVILMDLRMPGLSGEDAAAEIRRGGPNANCPIIAFSASADPHQMDDLRRRGFDGALPKPFTLADLIAAVESVLQPPFPPLALDDNEDQERHA